MHMRRSAHATPSIVDILSVTTPADLRTLGGFTELKRVLNMQLGLSMGARSWTSLYAVIRRIQAVARRSAPAHPNASTRLPETSQRRLSTVLLRAMTTRPAAHAQDAALSNAIARLREAAADPAVRYRMNRSRNFMHSSRLEGIAVAASPKTASLDAVLAKYRRT